MPPKRIPLRQRFIIKVVEEKSGCWRWLGKIHKNGYGQINAGGKYGKILWAHRVSFGLFIGPIPAGKEIDHLCRNKWCVNPMHLDPVTHRKNILRSVA